TMTEQHKLPIPENLGPPTTKPRSKSPEKEGEEFAQLFVHILRAPMVVWPGYEEDFKDKWDKVLIQRLAHHQDFVEGMCTEYEAMLYISTATLVAPPSHNWFNIYMWLFNRYMPEAAKANDLVGPAKLEGSEAEDLERLRRWIFKSQALHLKRKEQPEAEESKETRQLTKEVKFEQPRLI
ncbi:MAG: hypothetical protein Q7K03_09435, partial [Dehalococcoidia bacterium]|nr:hypothetical protein [Dehalococcoidia bacterium]